MPPEPINEPTTLYRVMIVDGDGRPVCGDGNNMLGARVPTDIKPDDAGLVHPERGGMSVSPDDPRNLPFFLLPLSLGGKGALPLFSLPAPKLLPRLSYRPDPKSPRKHGFVEPATPVLLAAYRASLAATQLEWRREA
jgi:hypothetical protein